MRGVGEKAAGRRIMTDNVTTRFAHKEVGGTMESGVEKKNAVTLTRFTPSGFRKETPSLSDQGEIDECADGRLA